MAGDLRRAMRGDIVFRTPSSCFLKDSKPPLERLFEEVNDDIATPAPMEVVNLELVIVTSSITYG